MFTKLNDYLNNLEKLNFVSAEDKTIQTEEGYSISLHCDFMKISARDRYPVQVVLRVSNKEFKNLSFYGCDSNEENATVCTWFFNKYYELQNVTFSKEREARDQAQKKLKKIIG